MNKADLFLAVREGVFLPVIDKINSILHSDVYIDPLDAIEAALMSFFQILDDSPKLRMIFEIMAQRCEYVAEFADVQVEINKPTVEFLLEIEGAYRLAAAAGTLRTGLDPLAVTQDTGAFISGLLYKFLGQSLDSQLHGRVGDMISSHMALRRHDLAI